MSGFIRGTITGKRYKHADCYIDWVNGEWQAISNNFGIVATGRSIKAIRNEINRMKLAKEGPWEKD